MTKRQCVLFTISTAVVFVMGLGLGLLLPSVGQDAFGTVKVKEDGYVSVQTSYGSRAHLSQRIVDELGRLNREMRQAEEISQGMWEMLFSDNGGPLQIRWHPDVLDILVLLKECDGQIDYSQFFSLKTDDE